MYVSLMNQYSDEEFIRIVKQSQSYTDCLKLLGYNSKSGDTMEQLKQKIARLEIDISHFYTQVGKRKLTPDIIFVKDSTVTQKDLRRWYKDMNYSPYKCSICGQLPEWQGKELTLILDHINGYNKDNRLENLRWICPNCNYQLDTTNGKNQNHGIHCVNTCIDCGKTISKKSTRCLECERKTRVTTEVKGVPREILKELIRSTSFTKIGEIYGVSDNAVRKWCDKYHLPRKVSEIKQLTDEEWLKI